MHSMRRQHDAAVKARVALEAIKGEKTIAQIAGEYGIHPNQIRMWRDRALAALHAVFSKGGAKCVLSSNIPQKNRLKVPTSPWGNIFIFSAA